MPSLQAAVTHLRFPINPLTTEKNQAKHLWLSLHLFFPFSLPPSTTPRTRLPFLSLENRSMREWVIDKCDTITSTHAHTHTHTRSDDWQAWHQSVTPQWLPVKTFDWQSPSPASSMCSLIMKQWNSASGQKPVFSPAWGIWSRLPCTKFSSALKSHFYCTRLSSCTVGSKLKPAATKTVVNAPVQAASQNARI